MNQHEKNWGAEEWRAPTVADDETIVFSEHGRVMNNGNERYSIDYRSHYFRIVKPEFGQYVLLVSHGGGQDRHDIGHGSKRFLRIMETMESDDRYYMLHFMYRLITDAAREATQETASVYMQAHTEGRFVRKKIRGRDAYKVYIKSA